ncbi:hypothetical protein SAMN05421780_11074 [Flexibacter flexilis DSM 6793]|uniref:Uncharacterized protein n=1 Tax=Flexibacter flexilis DSM 6793 TaxID=927664 RepID=A0A1I1M880_9BACT|nr:hypothetical protein SAMN05421780_11074 [Flexibacter flexilis DSM 6793]
MFLYKKRETSFLTAQRPLAATHSQSHNFSSILTMKSTTANTSVEVMCNCPICDSYVDILPQVSEILGDDHRAENCDKQVTCPDCNEDFIVTDINF